MPQKSDLAAALLPFPQRYKLHKMMSGSDQSRSAPTRSPLPWLIHTATKRFTPTSYLSAESLMLQAFNVCRDTKLHEWVSDPESLTKEVGEPLLLTVETQRSLAANFVTEPLTPQFVKGQLTALQIFRIVCDRAAATAYK